MGMGARQVWKLPKSCIVWMNAWRILVGDIKCTNCCNMYMWVKLCALKLKLNYNNFYS